MSPVRLSFVLLAVGLTALRCAGDGSDSLELGRSQQALVRPPSDDTADRLLGQVVGREAKENFVDQFGLAYDELLPQLAIDTSVTPPRLWLADTDNNRVLMFKDAASMAPGKAADLVLGQPDFFHSQCATTVTGSTLCHPTGVAVDSTGTVYVADGDHHRVLAFDAPAATDTIADRVFGQADLTSGRCNLGRPQASAASLCRPEGLAVDAAGRLYVADRNNHRVLRFDAPKTSATASAVLGQNSFTTRSPNLVDGRGFSRPRAIAFDRSKTPNRVYLSDRDNNRVLGWADSASFLANQQPTLVLGQPDLGSTLCRDVGRDALCGPTALAVDRSGNLYVMDRTNNRALLFLSPFTTDTLADKVFGQNDNFLTSGCERDLCDDFTGGIAVSPTTGEVAIADYNDFEVLVFKDPVSNDTLPDARIGDLKFVPDPTSLQFPSGVAFDSGGNLYVADTDEQRVVIYDAPAAGAPWDVSADHVIGLPDLVSTGSYLTSASTIPDPRGLALDDADNLWVYDGNERRVLGFLKPRTTNGVADLVIGQTSFTAKIDFSPRADASHITNNGGLTTDGTNLFVVDGDNHRVLRFDAPLQAPPSGTRGDSVPDGVVGQVGYLNNAANFVDGSSLSKPTALAIDASVTPARLWVADGGNHRVLSFPNAPGFSNGAAADKVLGQPDLGAPLCATGALICSPSGVAVDAAGNVYVSSGGPVDFDYGPNTVLLFRTPLTTDTVPDVVLPATKDDCITYLKPIPSATTTCRPGGLGVDPAGNLYLADSAYLRALLFKTPATTDLVADQVLGQVDMTTVRGNWVDARGLSRPSHVALDRSVTPNRVYVSDQGNNRVLGWPNTQALQDGQAATVVIGQPNFNASKCNGAGIGATTLCGPSGLAVDGTGRLYVADLGNNRVLAYDSPFTTDSTADAVFGQTTFTGAKCNEGGRTASTLCDPINLTVDRSDALYIADRGNERVLVFRTPKAKRSADAVFGQVDFTNRVDNSVTSPTNLGGPEAVVVDSQGGVYIADTFNSRVLGFPTTTTVNNRATLVLGQLGDLTTGVCFDPPRGLCIPRGLAIDANDQLYVSDASYSRVQRYDDPLHKGELVAQVFGQVTRLGKTCNQGDDFPTLATLCSPQGLGVDSNGSLYAADVDNHRVAIYFSNRPPAADNAEIDPAQPQKGSALTTVYRFTDPDGDAEGASEIRWYMKPSATSSFALEPAYNDQRVVPGTRVSRGQFWSFTVRPRDALSFGPLLQSPAVSVKNTPPVASGGTISPELPLTDVALKASWSYADADGDAQQLPARIEWFVNGVLRPTLTTDTVPPVETRRGEVWQFRVTPSDGFTEGAALISRTAYIQNSAPIARAGPDQVVPAAALETKVILDGSASTDLDDDPLDFRWSEGGNPLGAGQTLSTLFTIGTHHLTLVVTDPDRGTSSDDVTVTIGDPVPAAGLSSDRQGPPGRYDFTAAPTDPLNRPLTSAWKQSAGPKAVLTGEKSNALSVFARQSGLYVFDFVASAGTIESPPAQVRLTISNLPPTATVLARQVVALGEKVVLDGNPSADPNGDPLTFAWTLESGPSAPALDSTTSGKTSFTPAAEGLYTARLLVKDGALSSLPATAQIVVIDPAVKGHAPRAIAGKGPRGEVGLAVTLDGSLSTDPDGDRLTFVWRAISGGGELRQTSSARTGFVPQKAGSTTFGLVVSDGTTTSPEDTVTVEVIEPGNHWPVARAGEPRSAALGTVVTLDGTRSSDPDGDPLTLRWKQIAGPQITVLPADAGRGLPQRFVPTAPGLIALELTASDGKVTSLPSATTVLAFEETNAIPVAAIAAPERALVRDVVTLDGSGSKDPEGAPLSYLWEQLGGPDVPLSGAATASPKLTPVASGRYLFRLTVFDGAASSVPVEKELFVTTHDRNDSAPKANAGPDQRVVAGAVVQLDGSGSSDPDPLDGPALRYEWLTTGFPTGSEPVIDDPAAPHPTFTAASAGDYTFRLVVSDGELVSAPSFVTITAETPAGAKGCGCSSEGGPSFFIFGLAFALPLLRRREERGPTPLRQSLALLLCILIALPSSALAAPPPPAAKKGKPAVTKKIEPPLEVVQPDPIEPPPRAPGDGPPNPYLDEAKALYASFQFEGILSKLEFALAVKDVTPRQKVEIYKLMAFTHAGYDDAPRAEDALFKLLQIDPAYELTGVSPKIRGYFASARKLYRASLAVKLDHKEPRATMAGVTPSVDVAVLAGEDRIGSMTLHYRFRAEPPAPYSQTNLKKGDTGSWAAPVPNLFPGPAETRLVEYFIRARGPEGELLTSIGDEDHPKGVEVETAPLPRPIYKSPLFWTGAAIILGGAIASPFLLHKPDAASSAGSLGKEKLP